MIHPVQEKSTRSIWSRCKGEIQGQVLTREKYERRSSVILKPEICLLEPSVNSHPRGIFSCGSCEGGAILRGGIVHRSRQLGQAIQLAQKSTEGENANFRWRCRSRFRLTGTRR